MSSISLIWHREGKPNASRLLSGMLAAQAMYGPDKSFRWPEQGPERSSPGSIALGGNLLELLPEDRFDQQPVWSADRTACLVADVRLDNRDDLTRDLALSYPDELADSAVLMAAWMRWGDRCLNHILGAYAFAVWTPARQEVFAARDHTGERPLFFFADAETFALASMPKGLFALPGVFRGLDERRVALGMVRAQPDWTKTLFTGIERLPMGHFLRVTPHSCETKAYWHPSDAKPTAFERDEEYAEAFLEVFDRAAKARLRSTKAVGAELSAGLDSSAVAASAARLLGEEGKRLTAFTSVPRAGFHGKAPVGRIVDEGPGAAEVARFYPNIDHVLLDTSGRDLLRTLTTVTDALDEPVQNGVNQLWVSAILDQARDRGIGVMLQGAFGNITISLDGGEALSGMFRRGEWIRLWKTTNRLRDNGHISFRAAGSYATSGLLPLWLQRRLRPQLADFKLDYSPVHPDLAEKYNLRERMAHEFFCDPPSIKTMRAQFFEQFDFGPWNAAARATAGIDPRDPTGDKRVFDFCYSMPFEQYLAGGFTRSLVRRAMKGRLPDLTLHRTVRGLQGADWYLTLADALPSFREELRAIQKSPAARKMVDLARMERLTETWPEGGYESTEVENSWNQALCRGIAFGYFLRTHEAAARADGAAPLAGLQQDQETAPETAGVRPDPPTPGTPA